MQTKHLLVLFHIRNRKGQAGTMKLIKPSSNKNTGRASFVDPFCYLWIVSFMMSCLFIAVLLGKD